MARIRSKTPKWDDEAGVGGYHDMRRGAVEDAYWDEDELVDYRPKSKRKKKYPGCPGNDNGEHVYVNVSYDSDDGGWFGSWRSLVCCGCEKRKPTTFIWRLTAKKW